MYSRTLILITVLALLAIGCREIFKSSSSESEKPATVALTLDTTVDGSRLTIEGNTDLPDGSVISYEIQHEQFATRTDLPSEKLFADGEATVASGYYSSDIDLTGWPAGKVDVRVVFQTVLGTTKQQPPEIISRFGKLGERLEGPNVTRKGSLKRVEVSTPIFLQTSGD